MYFVRGTHRRRPHLSPRREGSFLRELFELFLGVLFFRAAWAFGGVLLHLLGIVAFLFGLGLMVLIAILFGAH